MCLFADDLVLLTSSIQDQTLRRFAAKCETIGITISTSKYEAIVFCWKTVDCSLRVRGKLLPHVKECKYLGVLSTSDGKMAHDMDKLCGAASLLMGLLC